MRLKRVFLSLLSVSLIILILLFPVQALQGAKNGLSAFALSVVPALFPFFVATGLFTKLGTVSRLSTVLRPLMRPLFGLPGQSALPVFLSVVSGYPNGARATAALYEAKQLTQTQARRTMAYASTVGPSFVISVLASSLLGNPRFAWALFLPHLLAAFLTGQIGRFCLPDRTPAPGPSAPFQSVPTPAFHRCFISAVQEAVTALLYVGGFIVFFFTLSNLLLALGVLPLLARIIRPLFSLFGYPPALALPFLRGLFEMTDGCLSLCATGYPAAALLPLLCALISFGGLCVQTQQALFVSPCGLRFSEGLFFKTVHGVLAFSLCSVLVRHITLPSVGTVSVSAIGFGRRLLFSTGLLFISALVLCLLCLCMSAYTLAYRKRTR